jgi:hypothetical protein
VATEVIEERPATETAPVQAAESPQEPAGATRDDGPVGLERRPTPFNAYAAVLTGLMTLTFLMFLLVEPTPRWLLIFGAAVAIAGMDGTLRATWREPFRSSAGRAAGGGRTSGETSPYLFLPGLYALSVPILAEHNVTGYWAVAAGLGAGAGFGAVVYAELASVRPRGRGFGLGRHMATAATYLTAFALFSLTYVFDLGIPTAMAAIALASAMLGIELFREGEVDPIETLLFAAIAGLVVAEVRWGLYFMPVDGYLAGLALLLAFFFISGLIHAHLTRHLDALAVAEYVTIAGLGVGLVVAAKMSGLA